MAERCRTGRRPEITAPLLAALLLPGLLAVASCAGETGRSGVSVTLDTLPGGVSVVHNRPPADRFASDAWRIREDLWLGSVLGEGPDAFGDVRGLVADRRGRIYVLDAHVPEIRAFGPDGEHLWSAGEEGEGPGEFLEPNGLTLGPEGRLWVPDHGANRYSLWSTDGEPLETRRTSFPVYGYLWHGTFDPAGRLVDRSLVFGPDVERHRILRRHRPDAGSVDTLPHPSRPPGWETPHYRFEHGGGGGVMGVPFAARFLWRLDRRGHVWFGTSDRYRIVQRTLEGDTVRVLTGRLEPVPVTREERERAEQDVLDFRDRIGGGEADLSRIPEHKAPIQGLSFDDRGRLWVRLAPEQEGTARFDIFNRRGRWQASAVAGFPVPEARTPVVRDSLLYVVVRDSLDVAHVVRALIER